MFHKLPEGNNWWIGSLDWFNHHRATPPPSPALPPTNLATSSAPEGLRGSRPDLRHLEKREESHGNIMGITE